MAKFISKDGTGGVLEVHLPVDVRAMRQDRNWLELLDDGSTFDHNPDNREDWDIPFRAPNPTKRPVLRLKRGK